MLLTSFAYLLRYIERSAYTCLKKGSFKSLIVDRSPLLFIYVVQGE
jgi:hypothetical protein